MKSTKNNPLNNLDLDQLRNVLRFCIILYRLNLKETDDIENAVQDEINDNYCSECEQNLDDCDCYGYDYEYEPDYDDNYEPDYDDNYDAHKDSLIMGED